MITFSDYLKRTFPNRKIQKLTVDGGFSCPNRDGSKGREGCSFCNPAAFAPAYCRDLVGIAEQIETGKAFFAHKHKGEVGYLVYFQSYSGTYASIDVLRERYSQALACDGVLGIVIGTRPDCITDETLNLLAEIHKTHYVMVEYGVESCYDRTLERVGRGHTFQCAKEAILATAQRDIPIGVHLILGLPGESHDEMLQEADIISKLPINVLKLHQLQIMRNTRMADEYIVHPEQFHLFSADEYTSLVADFVRRLRPDIALDRFAAGAPYSLLLAPKWGLKPHEVQRLVEKKLHLY